MLSPEISIITPVLNGGHFIEDCIRNVLEQNCQKLEHIIVDGGSSDETIAVIQRYANQYSHIRWHSEKDLGQSSAMNKGIRMAQAPIISFLNVDDYYEPRIVPKILEYFRSFPTPSILIGNCNVWGDKQELKFINRPRKLRLTDLLLGIDVNLHPVNPSAYFYHKCLHDLIGPYNPALPYTMDLDFLLRAVQKAKVIYKDETFGNQRLISGTKTYDRIQTGAIRHDVESLMDTYRAQLSQTRRLLLKFRIFIRRLLFLGLKLLKYLLLSPEIFLFLRRAEKRTSNRTIIILTPTFERRDRFRYMQRCIHTLRKLNNIFWIIVEDGHNINLQIQELLQESRIPHAYLCFGFANDKGNTPRSHAMNYVLKQRLDGVIYSLDDDNLVDRRIFNEIRKTKRISIFPVGNLGPHGIERPIVKDGKIVGWDAYMGERKLPIVKDGKIIGWDAFNNRKFPVDMASFAIDSSLIQKKGDTVWFRNLAGPESEFLEMFLQSSDELEVLCDNCTKCYVWHNQPLGKPIFYTRIMITWWNLKQKILHKIRTVIKPNPEKEKTIAP